jgi:hypothetical protein
MPYSPFWPFQRGLSLYYCTFPQYGIVFYLVPSSHPQSSAHRHQQTAAILFPSHRSPLSATTPRTQALSTVAQLGAAKFGVSLDVNALVFYPTVVAPIVFGWTLYNYAYVLYPILNEKLFAKLFG